MKLDYIDIATTIERFNNVLGVDWSTDLRGCDLHEVDSGGYTGVVTIQLTALGKSAVGVGADTGKDPDKVLKTALAEAIKKAGHQFGIALYLWDEGKRDEIAEYRKLQTLSIPALQRQLKEKNPSAPWAEKEKLASYFGVKESGLGSRQVLLHLLEG